MVADIPLQEGYYKKVPAGALVAEWVAEQVVETYENKTFRAIPVIAIDVLKKHLHNI